MNVHMHTQLRLVRIKYIQKRVQRVTPYAKCILYFMQINANLWESSLRGTGFRSCSKIPSSQGLHWFSREDKGILVTYVSRIPGLSIQMCVVKEYLTLMCHG